MRNKREKTWEERKGTILQLHDCALTGNLNKDNYYEIAGKVTRKDMKKRMDELGAYAVEYTRTYSKDLIDATVNYYDEEGNVLETQWWYVWR